MISVPNLIDATAQDRYNQLLVVNPACVGMIVGPPPDITNDYLAQAQSACAFGYLNDTPVLNIRFVLRNPERWALT